MKKNEENSTFILNVNVFSCLSRLMSDEANVSLYIQVKTRYL